MQAKEVVHQAVDYLGIGRVRPFLAITNEVLEARGVALPLPDQTTTTMENRLEAGNAKQVELFGEGMDKSYERSKVNYWLADNCFGDYYTRTGLTNLQREMITFCYLAAQGSVEPQLLAHTKANIALGNTADFLRTVVLQNLPYIGYPRTLNALRIVAEADKAKQGAAFNLQALAWGRAVA